MTKITVNTRTEGQGQILGLKIKRQETTSVGTTMHPGSATSGRMLVVVEEELEEEEEEYSWSS